ncbi:MAG TPA: N-methyl-D-aspartate receptor NMDAR2C subunit [Candidatus Paceibacterota bacterium]|nr:N-methyl-D-aspartate receptor NMDAR2C subunit [Candidatus Paceibacterota bacterium]
MLHSVDTKYKLEGRWVHLWKNRDLQDLSMVRAAFTQLYAKYTAPDRGYHGIGHIEHGLNIFEEVRHLARFPDAVEVAWWYHDVIYDVHCNDNEQRSADYAEHDLSSFGESPTFMMKVHANILATRHEGGLVDTDEQLICDIDLSSFGGSWNDTIRNSRGIRFEYRHVPEREYVASRRAILGNFLRRKTIYYLPFFIDCFEIAARENIMHEIEVLPELVGHP